MIFSMYDKAANASLFHGVTMVDYENKPIQFVVEFDTESYACRLNGGKSVIAAAFVLPCGDLERLHKMLTRLPDALQQFICYEPDPEHIEHVCQEFTQAQIDRTLRLVALAEGWMAEKQKEEEDAC